VAQLGTAPLTIYHFHQFPNYFMINNLVAVPVSGLIIYLACAFLFLGGIPYLGEVISWCLNSSLHWFLRFVHAVAEWPFALTENMEIHQIEVCVLYLLMLSIFVWIFLKRRKWIFAVLVLILFLQGMSISRYFKVQKRADLCQMPANSYICEKRNPC
jgi:competence protein ComEC